MALEHDKRAIFERRRNILYLMDHYLEANGLHATKQMLVEEAQLSPAEYQVCDNIDLDHVFLEFVSYYRLKFGKTPKIARRLDQDGLVSSRSSPNGGAQAKKQFKKQKSAEVVQKDPALGVSGSSYLTKTAANGGSDVVYSHTEQIRDCTSALCPEIMGYKGEWKELAEHVYRNLYTKKMNIGWNDIFGAEAAMTVLKESVLMPLDFPELFSIEHPPWRGLLVHGVPGVGKTLLAKALCSETEGKIAFFNITPSSIMSKWRGESEKLLRILFEIAQQNAPSVIFIDEIESFASKRDTFGDHEATKRFKNEFLTLLDGFGTEKCGVFILVTSNMPWDIDPAFLRRFERKVLLDLPDVSDRHLMMAKYLPNFSDWSQDVRDEFGLASANFTGDDIRIACKEATLTSIRQQISANEKPTNRKIQPDNLRTAFSHIRPLTLEIVQKHRDWNRDQGNRL